MDANLRAADADRNRVIVALQRHTADGRLSLDEFAARADAAYGAVTYADLAAITADLPADEGHRRSPRAPTALALVATVVLAVLLATGVAAQAAGLIHMDQMMAAMDTTLGGGCR